MSSPSPSLSISTTSTSSSSCSSSSSSSTRTSVALDSPTKKKSRIPFYNGQSLRQRIKTKLRGNKEHTYDEDDRDVASPSRRKSTIDDDDDIVVAEMKQSDADAEGAPTSTTQREKIGECKVLIVEGRELSDRKVGERRTYIEVSLEGSKSRTEQDAGANPQWNHESVHGVTDISNDVVITLYQHHHLKKDEKIAHAVIPLTRLTSSSHNPMSTTFTSKEWIEFYPVNYHSLDGAFPYKFPHAEHSVPRTGMNKPKKRLGFIQVQVTLTLFKNLAYCYAVAPPLKYRDENPVKFHKPTFKRNLKRIKRALKEKPHIFHYARYIIAWNNPAFTLITLVLFWHICFTMPVYQYPFVAAITLLIIGIASRLQTRYGWVVTWEEDADPYEWAKEGKIHKLKRYRGLLAKTSFWIGRIAGWLERSAALLNFTDFHLSLITHITFFIIASILAFILYVMAPHQLVFTIGFIILTHKLPKVIKSFLADRKARQLQAAGITPPTPTPEPIVDDDAADAAALKGINGNPPSAMTKVKVSFRQTIRKRVKPTIKFVAVGVKNVLARSPDGHEIGHRVIARRAVVKERVPPQIYGPNGPEVAPTPSVISPSMVTPSSPSISSPTPSDDYLYESSRSSVISPEREAMVSPEDDVEDFE